MNENVKEFFDVIIAGTSFAPLAAGALLSRRGLRILVVGTEKSFSENRSSLFSSIRSNLVLRIFEELGVTHMIRRLTGRPSPLFQVLLPGARIDVMEDKSKMFHEMRREFPAVASDIEVLFNMLPEMMEGVEKLLGGQYTIPPEGLLDRKRVERILSATPFGRESSSLNSFYRVVSNPQFLLFLRAVSASHCFIEPSDISPLSCLLLYARKVNGCAVFEGGQKELEKILCERIDAYGGEVRSGDIIEEIYLRNGKVRAIRLEGKESLIGCDFLIAGVESEFIGALLKDEQRIVDRRAMVGRELYPSGLLVTARLTVAPEAIPEAMASNAVIVFDASIPLYEANYLIASIDRNVTGKGKKVAQILLSYILSREKLEADTSYAKKVLEMIIRNLESVMPFVGRFIIDCSDPVEDILKSHFVEEPLLRILKFLPSIFKCKNFSGNPFFGPGYNTPVKNLYRVNTEVCPFIGEDGQWAAALGAANILASKFRQKTKLRRKIMFS